jgi:hypothetical protein
MTPAEPSIKERRHLSTSRTTGTMIGSFALPYCIEKKSKLKMMPMGSDALIFFKFVAQLLKSVVNTSFGLLAHEIVRQAQ